MGVKARVYLVAAGENLSDLQIDLKGPIVGGAVKNVMMHVPYDSDFGLNRSRSRGPIMKKALQSRIQSLRTQMKNLYLPIFYKNDSIADFYLTGLLVRSGDDTIKRYRSTSDAMAALAAGEVMAVMGPKAQLEYGLTSTTDVHEPPLPNFSVGKWTVGTAIHFAYKPLS